MAIKKTVQIEKTLTANQIYSLNLERSFIPQERPNTFQIRNFSQTSDIYVSVKSSLSTTNYEVKIPPDGTRTFVVLHQQVTELFMLSADSSRFIVNASYADEVYPNDLDQTQLINISPISEVKITDGVEDVVVNADGSLNVTITNVDPIEVNIDVAPEIEIKNDVDNPIPTEIMDGANKLSVGGNGAIKTRIIDGDEDMLEVNANGSLNVVVDDSTPIDVNVTNASIVIDDSTPIDVNVTTFEKDTVTDSIQVITTDHANIHKGLGFSISQLNDAVANNGTILFEVIVPAGAYVHFKQFNCWTNGSKAKFEVIEAPTLTTGATVITPINRRRVGTPSISLLTVKSDPTVISGGTTLESIYFGSGGGASKGGDRSLDIELVLKPDTTNLIRITNLDGNAKDFSTFLFWYEESAG